MTEHTTLVEGAQYEDARGRGLGGHMVTVENVFDEYVEVRADRYSGEEVEMMDKGMAQKKLRRA